ncbi:MAG: M23 family metallopeptidase, partial [Acetobacteraceae bacterium]
MRARLYVVAFGCLWPVYALYWAWGEKGASGAELVLNAVIAGYFLFLLRWDIVPWYARVACLAAVIVAAERGWGALGVGVAVAALAGIWYWLWRPPSAEGADMKFPLGAGSYFVVQGGRSSLTNHHASAAPQRYALDIVKLNWAGARAAGLYPGRLASYAIFGDVVSSPCDGVVARAVDGLPDLCPGVHDPFQPGGNHVVIRSEDGRIDVKLSHLMRGSVLVRGGDRVRSGQELGRVGNSGNTSEPHLHVHAVRRCGGEGGGEALPLRFGKRWLVRNSI